MRDIVIAPLTSGVQPGAMMIRSSCVAVTALCLLATSARAAVINALASFNYGLNPHAGLIADSAGNLYGTTLAGGQACRGTVFKLPAGSNSITTLTSFANTDGA